MDHLERNRLLKEKNSILKMIHSHEAAKVYIVSLMRVSCIIFIR